MVARAQLTSEASSEELDLRAVATAVKERLGMIVGIGIVAALVGVAASLLTPTLYAARTLIAVTRPQYSLNFAPPFQPGANQAQDQQLQESLPRVVASLALSDDVLNLLITSGSAASPEGNYSIDIFRRTLRVKPTTDPSLVALTVDLPDPQQAAALANAWADQVVTRVNSIYGQDSGNLADFESRTAAADAEVSKAETALTDFEAQNKLPVFQSQLDVSEKQQQQYLSDREGINRLSQDVQGLRRRLAGYPRDGKVSIEDNLTALLLETKAFNTNATSAGVPIQLQIPSGQGAVTKTTGETIAILDDLEIQSTSEATYDQSRINDLGPTILDLQGRVQQTKSEESRLTENLKLASDRRSALIQQTEEVRTAAQATNGRVKIASRASPPSSSVSSHLILNTVVAGCFGLILGLAAILAQKSYMSR